MSQHIAHWIHFATNLVFDSSPSLAQSWLRTCSTDIMHEVNCSHKKKYMKIMICLIFQHFVIICCFAYVGVICKVRLSLILVKQNKPFINFPLFRGSCGSSNSRLSHPIHNLPSPPSFHLGVVASDSI